MTETGTTHHDHPAFVGCYRIGAETHFYPVRWPELDRSAIALSRVLRSFNFAPESFVMTVSLTEEVAQFAPFEQAVQILGLYGTNADLSPFDAGRIESLARQFDPVAICGVGKAALEGLAMMGHDAASVFKGRTVWARPDAYDEIASMEGVDAHRCALIGPALALECASGGLHVDGREWAVREQDGALLLSSRMQRVAPISDLATGYQGTTVDMPCACGSPDPCITLAG